MSAEEPRRRHGIVILGTPRSGGAALAGILGEAGCAALPADGTGALNDAILAAAGSSRGDWRAVDPGWSSSAPAGGFLARGRALLDAAKGGPDGRAGPVVFEDAATARLLPFWRTVFEAAGVRPFHVLLHRDPASSAAALHGEEGHPPDHGLLSWMRHALDAEIGTRGRPRLFASAERVRRDPVGIVEAIREKGAIAFPRDPSPGGGADGPASGAGGEGASGPAGSRWSGPVFDILERWAESGEDPEDHAALDAIRAQVDAAAAAFGPLVALLHADIEALERDRDALRRAARLDRIRMRDGMRRQLVDLTVAQRGRSDPEMQALRDAARTARDAAAAALAERDALAADLAGHRARVAALEDGNALILNSTSWKLTAPVRRLMGVLRR